MLRGLSYFAVAAASAGAALLILRWKSVVETLDARVIEAVEAAFAEAQNVSGGRVYDSQNVAGLSDVQEDLFGVSIVSISGKKLSLGTASTPFLAQSTFKPLVFAYALQKLGSARVFKVVADTGCKGYRADTIEPDGRAHNALINSGALSVMQSLSQAGHSVSQAVAFVQALEGPCVGTAAVSTTAYQATLADSAHNYAFCRALGKHDFFPDTDEAATAAVDWYSQLDCLQTDATAYAHVAACLANGGVAVGTGRVLSQEHTAAVLSTMLSSGMYEAAGSWAREVGIPAKSGVSGCIIGVVPGKFGIVSYSPRIDQEGNSVQGTAFFQALARRLPELSVFSADT